MFLHCLLHPILSLLFPKSHPTLDPPFCSLSLFRHHHLIQSIFFKDWPFAQDSLSIMMPDDHHRHLFQRREENDAELNGHNETLSSSLNILTFRKLPVFLKENEEMACLCLPWLRWFQNQISNASFNASSLCDDEDKEWESGNERRGQRRKTVNQ